jgi:hypothetical protein
VERSVERAMSRLPSTHRLVPDAPAPVKRKVEGEIRRPPRGAGGGRIAPGPRGRPRRRPGPSGSAGRASPSGGTRGAGPCGRDRRVDPRFGLNSGLGLSILCGRYRGRPHDPVRVRVPSGPLREGRPPLPLLRRGRRRARSRPRAPGSPRRGRRRRPRCARDLVPALRRAPRPPLRRGRPARARALGGAGLRSPDGTAAAPGRVASGRGPLEILPHRGSVASRPARGISLRSPRRDGMDAPPSPGRASTAAPERGTGAERWQSGRMRQIANLLRGNCAPPRVRIPASPPRPSGCASRSPRRLRAGRARIRLAAAAAPPSSGSDRRSPRAPRHRPS